MLSLISIWLVICAIFFGVPFWALRSHGFDFRLSKREVISVLLVTLAVCGLALSVIGRSDTVRVWDSGAYWQSSLEKAETLRERTIADGLEQVATSVAQDDYNAFLPTLFSLPVLVLGRSYVAFAISVCLMSVLPAAYILAKLLGKLSGVKKGFVWFFLSAVFVLPILHPPLVGYFDAALLVPIATLLYLTLTMDFRSFKLKTCVWTAVLCLLILLTRRYFAFFLVGYVVAWLAKTVVEWVRCPSCRKIILVNYVKSMLMIGAICMMVLLLLFMPVAERLLVDYADMYSAWQRGDLWFNVRLAVKHFGLLPISVAMVGLIYLVKQRLEVAVFLVASILVSFFLFTRTQSMDAHHMYILSAQMILLVGVGFFYLVKLLSRWVPDRMALSAVVAIGSLCFLSMLVSFGGIIFSNKKLRPVVRHDMATLGNIVADIEYNADDIYYILASSEMFGSETLNSYRVPRVLGRLDNLLLTHDADLRDGWPTRLFDADVVMVADPIQLHLSQGQEVVRIPAEELLAGVGIGSSYEIEREYSIDRNITVKVYRRIKDIEMVDRVRLAEMFDILYPNRGELFSERIMGGG